jgi:hypothetical protein
LGECISSSPLICSVSSPVPHFVVTREARVLGRTPGGETARATAPTAAEERERQAWLDLEAAQQERRVEELRPWEEAAEKRGGTSGEAAGGAWESFPPSRERRSKDHHDPERRAEADAKAAEDVAEMDRDAAQPGAGDVPPGAEEPLVVEIPAPDVPASEVPVPEAPAPEVSRPGTAGGGAPEARAVMVGETAAAGASSSAATGGAGPIVVSDKGGPADGGRPQQTWAAAGSPALGEPPSALGAAVTAVVDAFAACRAQTSQDARAANDRLVNLEQAVAVSFLLSFFS